MSFLQQKRTELGLTQAEVAERAMITRQHYTFIENGDRYPSLPVANRIARALGCTLDECFGNMTQALGVERL